MDIPTGVVDLHIHIQPWEQLRPEVRRTMTAGRADMGDIERFQRDPNAFAAHLTEHGIARAGLVNYPAPKTMGFHQGTNDFVASYRDQRPDVFLAWGGLDPSLVADPEAEMVRLLDQLKLDGIKIHPPHQGFAVNDYLQDCPALATVYEACQSRRIPVMIHTGTSIFPGARSRLGDPMPCDDVAVDFPDLPLILAHCGRPLWFDQAFFIARRHPNVFLELSGIPPASIPKHLPRLEMLADKVLWGTDWPSPGVRNLRKNLETFWSLPTFQEEFKRKVLVDNANRLFPPRNGKNSRA